MALTPTARCGNHPSVAAVEICKRCGTFLCGDCLDYAGDDPYCSKCFALV